ncbi:o-succinylbenzoate synthase [Adhaeribacter swui]|uniref:O-succinylbenzoate synthase n=1 Tax=Adhaeribacter swui TaxID=2086471 RepID=A0A7G7GBN5_9BACT|nr:o-succinylbenzoate synthase [Adhaeribacter swui]QNF34569.1 o-succinylbenzoate synthase [Adhaeribacter swui]
MAIQASVQKHLLNFKFDARTSRGAMQQHEVFYLKLQDTRYPEITGIGECAPLPGLSPEHDSTFEHRLNTWVSDFNKETIDNELFEINYLNNKFNLQYWPSLRFALETAWLDWQQQGSKKLFNNSFSRSQTGIPINGLIWMGDQSFMQQQIEKKLKEGFSCLKLKIGGLDFNTELAILKQIREVASPKVLSIRLDANGAFAPERALNQLEQLSQFAIHSIEQPIKPRQHQVMAYLCRHSPIPIALDEELIGVVDKIEQQQMLLNLKPAYIILKPTLLGGFQATREWIALAAAQNISWWITSALESNIGLNAISQFTAEYNLQTEQGLGTGQLYHNNVRSPLTIRSGKLYYEATATWDLQPLWYQKV